MEKSKQTLPQIKSNSTGHTLSPRVSDLLLGCTSLTINSKDIIEVAETLQKDLLQGYKSLTEMDKVISGVGLHNVNKTEGTLLTGAYRSEFRGLFRPIQYVYKFLSYNDLPWTAREIVRYSCLHIENAAKYRFTIPDSDKSSLGKLLWNKKSIRTTLEAPFLRMLTDLNDTVYGKNKHTIEHIDLDAHDFSPADAIGMYFICRWAGVKLLEPTGLFSKWESK